MSTSLRSGLISNPTTTGTKVTISRGASLVRVEYTGIASPAGAYLTVAFNATTDTEAATMLTTSGQHFVVALGESRVFDFGTRQVFRMDIASNVASETGTTAATYNIGEPA